MALSGQVSCGFRHGTVDALQVPLAAFKEKSPVNQKNLFSGRFFVLDGNIAEY